MRHARLEAAAAAAGALLALQARVNGGLAGRVGSPVVAALVSFAVGTAALGLILLARRRPVRFERPAGGRRPWWFLGGFGGAFLVATGAAAVPVIGVALLTIGIVAGQTAGGLFVDRAGISPRGHQPLSPARVGGAALAVAAVVLAGAGRAGEVDPLLFGLVVLSGSAVAVQQAANGHVQRISGDMFAAAFVNFVVGTLALGAVVLALLWGGRLATPDWPADPLLYAGGLGGASYVAMSAAVVGRLGVLRVTLASIAGQLAAGVLLDALAPAGGRLDAVTVGAAALTGVAVAVAGGAVRRRPRPGGAGSPTSPG